MFKNSNFFHIVEKGYERYQTMSEKLNRFIPLIYIILFKAAALINFLMFVFVTFLPREHFSQLEFLWPALSLNFVMLIFCHILRIRFFEIK